MDVAASAVVAAVRPRAVLPAPGTPVTCGVSGGADSLALLAIAVAHGLEVVAVHVDHGLRPGSAAEADLVADAAREWGAGFRAERVVVAPGPDLEARARRARHGVLGADALLAHTADDQAETVLLALMRGAGLDGLSGMSTRRHPILALRRAETEAVCADLGVVPFEDPTNRDLAFRRNRVRHEVIPLLSEIADRDVVPVLCRMAGLLADDLELLTSMALDVDPTSSRSVREAPVPVARLAVRAWLRPHLPDGQPPDAAAVSRVLAVAAGDAIGTEVAGGVSIRRSDGRLEIVPPRCDG